jgi:hypothetical protein
MAGIKIAYIILIPGICFFTIAGPKPGGGRVQQMSTEYMKKVKISVLYDMMCIKCSLMEYILTFP